MRLSKLRSKAVAVLCIQLVGVVPAVADPPIQTPTVPLELPVEIETELAPAGSLKQAPLWHELAELLEEPDEIDCPTPGSMECLSHERRASFIYRDGAGNPCAPGSAGCVNVPMPALNLWSPCYNVPVGQPLRRRVIEGVVGEEISFDQPGILFGPDDGDPATPVTQVIGALVALANGSLVVSNPTGNPGLPADGAVAAIPACDAEGRNLDEDGNVITEFETPISELDFLRPDDDIAGVPLNWQPFIGRPAAQVLGKALFWDMQVGSDGVQACATCHFHAGVDNRTKNQLNPNHLGGDLELEVRGPNQDLTAGDFPFHKLHDPDAPGEPLLNPGNVARDSNDVMSSMGVRFRKFADIPPIGSASFGPASNPSYPTVKPLLPDLASTNAADNDDPIDVFDGLRRVEPRNTPTIFSTAFNFDSFWDGRARHDFNGGSVFGPTDPQFHIFIDPGAANDADGSLTPASNGHIRPEMIAEDPEVAAQPVRIRFSSLGSLATGPALSDFEMSFAGRNWPKIAKKLLQQYVVPLANQLVDPNDSVLGPFSNQRGYVNGPVSYLGRPGLNIPYRELIRLAFVRQLWHNTGKHLNGAPAACTSALNGVLTPAGCDPFDGYKLTLAPFPANPYDRNQFSQVEANFSLFFGLALQAWQQILIPDDTPFDRFMDANPLAANAVGQPGEQGTLAPDRIRALVTGSPTGSLNMVPGFGPDEILGFDIFSGANLTAVLPVGSPRNPAGVGSNPFLRSARCMLCHLGPEQTDHTNNVNAGLILGDTEFELPPPGEPEPTGPFRAVTGIALAEETEENAQDGVEVENRNFAIVDDPATPWDDRQVGVPNGIAFQDNGVYNIGVRPTAEDVMRGGTDAFGWPLALAAMALKNLAGVDFEAPDDSSDAPNLIPFGAADCEEDESPSCAYGSGLFEPTEADQRINPGLQMEPANPLLPPYLAPWANNLPAGELHPEVDELAFAPNTITEPPFAEFAEILFSSDTNCSTYDPSLYGNVAPNFGWGPQCPNSQSAIPNNFPPPMNGTFPFANRVARMGAVKAPQLRNVELTGPYFHTGSYLTLRQVVDFYMRGGDFPMTNAEHRDPNLVAVDLQAFGFGTTMGLPPQFMDGIPDVISQYASMPDAAAATPEYLTPEEAKVALVKFLIALTDERVRYERAPFDHPEIIIPLEGDAPDNAGGRAALLANPKFRQIPAVGAGGRPAPLANYLGISSTAPCTVAPPGVPAAANSHFCR